VPPAPSTAIELLDAIIFSNPLSPQRLPRASGLGLAVFTSAARPCEDAGVDPELQQRIAANEALRREVNEAIERGRDWPGEQDFPVAFRCECAHVGCNQLVEITVREYELVRSNPRRFIVAPGHERADAEKVVGSAAGVLVVEKVGQAGAVAEGTDPRE
jgi:hypothetical protein